MRRDIFLESADLVEIGLLAATYPDIASQLIQKLFGVDMEPDAADGAKGSEEVALVAGE